MSSVLLGLVAALSWGVNDLPHAAVARRAAGPLASSAWADGWTRCCALAAILAAGNPPNPAVATWRLLGLQRGHRDPGASDPRGADIADTAPRDGSYLAAL